MVPYSPFTVASFLNIIHYFFDSGQCPVLSNYGGYPTCNNYQGQTFDFIIVGAGAAGCPLANRLSENQNVKVLLIEEGPLPSLVSEIPLEFIFLQRTQYDYNITIHQDDMFQAYDPPGQGRMCQGRGLGGGTTVNAMIDLRGVPYDYDRWANVIQDSEWSYDNVKPYFDKFRDMVETTQYTSINPLRYALAGAAKDLGYSVNDPDDIFGFHDTPLMIEEDVVRNSIADAYLKPVANRTNLCVLSNRSVKKILIDPETKTAHGVLIQEGSDLVRVEAKREVIISAGAINSPKLLMVSGIGLKDQLAKSGIEIIEDLPVGKLFDHFYVPVFIQTPGIVGFNTHEEYIESYCTLGFPMNNLDITNFIGMFSSNGDQTHPNVEVMPAAYPVADQVFLPQALKVVGYSEDIKQQLTEANQKLATLFFVISNLHPISESSVQLNPTDPQSTPFVQGNYLNDPADSEVLIDVILNVVVPMIDTIPFILSNFLRFRLPECDSIPIEGDFSRSRDYWQCYLRHFATSELHPMGTCRMGTDRFNSVVDSHMKVHGIRQLRVVDSSSIPATISGHPTVPVVMIAEKAADYILKENGLI